MRDYDLKDHMRCERRSLRLWMLRSWWYRLFNVYIASFFITIYLIAKHRGDFDAVSLEIAMRRKEVDYQMRKLREREVEWTNAKSRQGS